MTSTEYDTETTGLNVWTGDRPFALSACWGEDPDDLETGYVEAPVDPFTRVPDWSGAPAREARALLARRGRKGFWNAKFDFLMLEAVGLRVDPAVVDEVLFMAKAVNNLEFSYELKALAKRHVDIDDGDEAELRDAVIRARRLGKRLKWAVAEDLESDYWMPSALARLHPGMARDAGIRGTECEKYARRDARRTRTLRMMYELAMVDLDVRHVYEREMELWPVTLEMERVGCRIDPERMERVRRECLATIERYQAVLDRAARRPKCRACAGAGCEDVASPCPKCGGSGVAERFNVNSPKQIVGLLFEGPNALPVLKRTKTGQPKTDAEALAPHKRDPRVEAVFRVRANTRAANDFFGKYARLATTDAEGQMILHPGCRQWGTLTGRYSMSEPNLQQVSDPDTSNSISAEFMVDVRQVFVPRRGCVCYCPDYSQVEVIIFASISGEPAMIDAIRRGEKVHDATAERIWGGRGNERAVEAAMELLGTRDRRRAEELLDEHGWSIRAAESSLEKETFKKKAKSVTFTKIFGGREPALMRWIGVDRPTAKRILSQYEDAFPTLMAKMGEIERQGRADGYVVNPFGRRLAVDPWNAYRAVNHVVQSAAADLMKMGMLKTHAYLRDTGLDARLMLTVHDEIIFEFRREHAFKSVLRELCRLMADHGGAFCVPTPVSIDKFTERWSDKQEVKL